MLALPARHDEERRQQRPDRRADVAADLEQRLREPVPPARRHPRDARGLGVKHRRPDAHQRRRRAAASASCRRVDSSSSPTSVNAMPTTSEYGVGRRSVYRPTSGCSSDAVSWQRERDQADLREAQVESDAFKIG